MTNPSSPSPQHFALQSALADILANQTKLRPSELVFTQRIAQQVKQGAPPVEEQERARLSLIWHRIKGIPR